MLHIFCVVEVSSIVRGVCQVFVSLCLSFDLFAFFLCVLPMYGWWVVGTGLCVLNGQQPVSSFLFHTRMHIS